MKSFYADAILLVVSLVPQLTKTSFSFIIKINIVPRLKLVVVTSSKCLDSMVIVIIEK